MMLATLEELSEKRIMTTGTDLNDEAVDGLSSSAKATAAEIARQLSETNAFALGQIKRIVQRLGTDQALAFLKEALEVETGGGLTTSDKKRRRTLGGVYFYLVKHRISAEDRRAIWPLVTGTAQKKKKPVEPFPWEERLNIVPDLLKEKGAAPTVKIILVGRPGRVVEKGQVVLTSMQSTKTPLLPKGLPVPPAEPTTYLVYIARKQWNKVKDALQDPDDALIIEGYPAFDSRLKAVAVFATNTTTKLLEAAKRETQRTRPDSR